MTDPQSHSASRYNDFGSSASPPPPENRRVDRQHSRNRWIHAAFLLFNSLYVLLYWQIEPRLVFDDAYIFMRYARNLRAGLGYVYNPGEAPVDGITSPTWLALIALAMPARGVLPADPAVFIASMSFLSGIVLVVALQFALIRTLSPPWDILAGPVAFLFFARLSLFAAHLNTGMETLFAASIVAMFVCCVGRSSPAVDTSRWRSLGRGTCIGLLGFVLILSRPEAGLLALGCPTLKALEDKRRGRIREARVAMVVVVTTLALLACYGAWRIAYFGRLLPLPFHAKGIGGLTQYIDFDISGELLHGYHWYTAVRILVPDLLAIASLLIVTRSVRGTHWLWIPLGCTFLYISQAFQVMGYAMRYYIPYLPILILLAASTSASSVAQAFPPRRVLAVFLLLVTGVSITAGTGMAVRARYKAFGLHPESDPASSPINPQLLRLLFGRFPPKTSLAATEVGLIGLVFPEGRVDDLSGLNDPRHCRGFSVDEFYRRSPDVVSLVHWHYRGIVRAIVSDPRWAEYQCVYGHGYLDDPEVLYLQVWARRDFVTREEVDVTPSRLRSFRPKR